MWYKKCSQLKFTFTKNKQQHRENVKKNLKYVIYVLYMYRGVLWVELPPTTTSLLPFDDRNSRKYLFSIARYYLSNNQKMVFSNTVYSYISR